ncbi:MAG: hypothetical protein C0418_06430 [Coriobacteriaceae bacterium]|nr:hypothetical protein [Coriobacteriaceae bacterium]
MSSAPKRAAAVIAAAAALLLALAGCTRGVDVPPPTDLPSETTVTQVYYATGRSLVQERAVVDASDAYASTLRVLLAAQPKTNEQIAIVQPVAEVRSVTFDDGTITVDWSADVLAFEAEPDEKRIALAGILRTFGEFAEVDKVRFTVEGKVSGTAGGRDIEAFWGDVSLQGQPWDVLRPPSGEASETAQ